jgi:hypothetical protein
MAEKEKPKEKTKEEKIREIALKNLESSLWKYAAPKFISHAEYGNLADASEDMYAELIKKSPDQHVYEQLFLPQLSDEGGAITSPYLQVTSARILQESLLGVKVGDALKYAGYKGSIAQSYKNKYVNQLDKKEAGLIVGSVIRFKSDELVKGILDIRQKEISKGLEALVAEKPKEGKGK